MLESKMALTSKIIGIRVSESPCITWHTVAHQVPYKGAPTGAKVPVPVPVFSAWQKMAPPNQKFVTPSGSLSTTGMVTPIGTDRAYLGFLQVGF